MYILLKKVSVTEITEKVYSEKLNVTELRKTWEPTKYGSDLYFTANILECVISLLLYFSFTFPI